MGLDYEKIGRRIAEERKHFRKVSQEKMAEDLGMYQADISNLERAKSGSGIYDLHKLELIADYFGISIESLLFGTTEEAHMVSYGHDLELKEYRGKIKTKKQKEVLDTLTGADVRQIQGGFAFEYGPLICYAFPKLQMRLTGEGCMQGFSILKFFLYLFYDDRCIANMIADQTLMEPLICFPKTRALSDLIGADVLDPFDALRTLNPYGPLESFADSEEEREHYGDLERERMNELAPYLEDTALFVESVYVAEDYRRHGYCRLLFDILRKKYGDVVVWANMEPSSGAELSNVAGDWPSLEMSDVGQISLNACVAEHLGFTIDPDDWHRQVEMVTPDGKTEVRTVLVRKCAHYLPPHIQKIVENDGDLVAIGYAMQREKQKDRVPADMVTINDNFNEKRGIYSMNYVFEGKKVYVFGVIRFDADEGENEETYGISYRDPAALGDDGDIGLIRKFDSLEEALQSPATDGIQVVAGLLRGYESLKAEEGHED
jgi:transcriptional regulator with XRE-family HTH domain